MLPYAAVRITPEPSPLERMKSGLSLAELRRATGAFKAAIGPARSAYLPRSRII